MERAIIRKKEKVRDDIYKIIRNDIPLRAKIAGALSIEVQSVYLLAVRESTKFSLPFIVKIIEEHTGKKTNEILANE